MKESQTLQKVQHDTRNKLTQSFSNRVDGIGSRLKHLEAKKLQLSQQYTTLQTDLQQCMTDFQYNDTRLQELMKTPLSSSIMKLLDPTYNNKKSSKNNHEKISKNKNLKNTTIKNERTNTTTVTVSADGDVCEPPIVDFADSVFPSEVKEEEEIEQTTSTSVTY